jgi:hypothetical protein
MHLLLTGPLADEVDEADIFAPRKRHGAIWLAA